MNRLKYVRQFSQKFYKNHLVIVNSLQAGLIMVTGDALAQTVVERKKFDIERSSHFFIIGVGFVGPSSSIWYQILNKYVSKKVAKTMAVKKVLLDQLLFAPVCLCIFLILINKLQKKDWEDIRKEFHSKYFAILTVNYSVWPLVQLVNFYMIPLRYQVPFVQCIGVFWNIYLSWRVRKEQ